MGGEGKEMERRGKGGESQKILKQTLVHIQLISCP